MQIKRLQQTAAVALIAVLGASAMLSSASVEAKAAKAKSKPAPAKKAKPKQTPGGANQVEGLNGKIGQMLFDGKWRFQVQDVSQVDTYKLKVPSSEQDYAKYHDVAEEDLDTHTFTPKEGYTFIAVQCLVKNGQNKVQQLDAYLNDPKTGLADDQGNSYPPIIYDMHSKGAWVTKPLLPGSQATMTVLFAVPTGTKPKDLVFTLKNWSDSKGHDARVSLAK